MKIEYKRDTDIPFTDVEAGEVFSYSESKDVFIKTAAQMSRGEKNVNAISLLNGKDALFSSGYVVYIVDAVLVIN